MTFLNLITHVTDPILKYTTRHHICLFSLSWQHKALSLSHLSCLSRSFLSDVRTQKLVETQMFVVYILSQLQCACVMKKRTQNKKILNDSIKNPLKCDTAFLRLIKLVQIV